MSILDMSDAQLAAEWLEAKETERQAIERRRAIEDHLAMRFELPVDLDGTKNIKKGGYQFKVVGRLTRKIDSDLLQELAAEHGLSDHLSSLFRWKPELNMSAWKAADESITRPLAGAITAKPGRPSFTLTKKD